MIGISNFKISFFSISQKHNKFEPYADTFDEGSFTEIKDELEAIIHISNVSHEFLQDELIGPRIFQQNKRPESEKRRTDRFYILLMGFA